VSYRICVPLLRSGVAGQRIVEPCPQSWYHADCDWFDSGCVRYIRALVLGLAAIFQPITSHRSVVKRDIPIMLGISVYLFFLSLNSTLGRIEGATLFIGIILYTYFNYSTAMKESREVKGRLFLLE